MSPAPLYEQIKQHITDLIETGELGPNDRLPSETDLAAEFQVARMTVHRAIKELKDSGVVTRIAGVGTFVAETQSSGRHGSGRCRLMLQTGSSEAHGPGLHLLQRKFCAPTSSTATTST